MNGGLTRDCAGLSYNSYKISCGNPEATLRSKIGAEILFLAKTFQAGRAPSNGANAPKNERSVTSGVRRFCFFKSLAISSRVLWDSIFGRVEVVSLFDISSTFLAG
jgi:hypothetical protein